MKKKINKNLILILVAVILSLTYAVSFVKPKNTRKAQKTVLVNGKYKKTIESFEITQGEKSITVKKDEATYVGQPVNWVITSENGYKIAADKTKIEKFLTDLCTLREVYQVSEKLDVENDHFGFYKDSAIHINYITSDNISQEIIVGDKNFAQTGRYIMSGTSEKVFEINEFLEPYLYTSLLQWADPDIISKNVLRNFKEENVQQIEIHKSWNNYRLDSSKTKDFADKVHKLLQYRHGGFPEIEEPKSFCKIIKIYLGNKDYISLNFYPYKINPEDNENYFVEIWYSEHYNTEGNEKGSDHTVLRECKTISKWTYDEIDKLLEFE